MTVSVLFVCLGNICRSPLAQAAFRAEAERLGLDVKIDSAGTSDWHVGKGPDPRSVAVARRNGVDISHLRARQVAPEDFHSFHHIVAMDRQNLADLRALAPAGSTAKLSLLLDHAEGGLGRPVADPYHADTAGFDTAWAYVTEGAKGLARAIVNGA